MPSVEGREEEGLDTKSGGEIGSWRRFPRARPVIPAVRRTLDACDRPRGTSQAIEWREPQAVQGTGSLTLEPLFWRKPS